jgi:hypothetical protein
MLWVFKEMKNDKRCYKCDMNYDSKMVSWQREIRGGGEEGL